MASIDLQTVYQIARQMGFDEDAARVAMAIARTEGALNGQVGDNGMSFGPFQFHAQGQLPAFAQAMGVGVQQAAQLARTNPVVAVQWALGSYLGNAIKQGQAQGLSGAQLATYAQANGQRSVSPERAGQNYMAVSQNAGGTTMPDRGEVIREYTEYKDEGGNWLGQGGTRRKYTYRLYQNGDWYLSVDGGAEEYQGQDEASGEALLKQWSQQLSSQSKESAPSAADWYETTDPQTGDKWLVSETQRDENGEPVKIKLFSGKGGSSDLDRREQELDIAKKERELAPQLDPYTQTLQQYESAMNTIQQRVASGDLTVQEANSIMEQLRQTMTVGMVGGTSQTQRQNLASDVLQQNLSTGSNMVQGLLSGLGSIYGKIMSGTGAPLMNPLSIAKNFTMDMGGGPQLSELARSILTGALQEQQASPMFPAVNFNQPEQTMPAIAQGALESIPSGVGGGMAATGQTIPTQKLMGGPAAVALARRGYARRGY